MCWVCVLCFSLFENQRWCAGYAQVLLSVLCGQLNPWLHYWIQEQTNTVFPLTGSVEYPGENIPCKKVSCQINSSLVGLSWGILGLWTKLSLMGGVCLGRRRVAGRRHTSGQSEQKLLIASSFRKMMKETNSRVSLSPTPWPCAPLNTAL